MEVERQDGSVADVWVTYLWLPYTCSHCHQLGHIIIYCPKVTCDWVPPTGKDHKDDDIPKKASVARGKRKPPQNDVSDSAPSISDSILA